VSTYELHEEALRAALAEHGISDAAAEAGFPVAYGGQFCSTATRNPTTGKSHGGWATSLSSSIGETRCRSGTTSDGGHADGAEGIGERSISQT
jgi:hypothetical protein